MTINLPGTLTLIVEVNVDYIKTDFSLLHFCK
jgi:hypothetical protein